MTTKLKVTLATSSAMSNSYHGEEGLLDALAERGCDPSIKIWNDPDVDWTNAGIVIVRSVSDHPLQRQVLLEWTKKVPRILNHPDILKWDTHKTYLRSPEKCGLPMIPTVWLEPEQNLSKHQIHTRFPASDEFIVRPAMSSGVRDTGRYTTLSTVQRQAVIAQVQQLLGAGRTVMPQHYLEGVGTYGEISLVFFDGLMSHAVEERAVLHPAAITEPTMHEAVVTVEAADHIAWQWGEQIRRVLHFCARERIGRDKQSLFNRADIVPDDEGPFRVMEVSLVDADLYLAATPEVLDNFAGAISTRAHWRAEVCLNAPVEMSVQVFEGLVADALEEIPDEFWGRLDNAAIFVEDEPPTDMEFDTLGVYDGVALTQRCDYAGVLPDRILVFRELTPAMCETEEEVAREVRVTVTHKVGHCSGIDDEALHELGWVQVTEAGRGTFQ